MLGDNVKGQATEQESKPLQGGDVPRFALQPYAIVNGGQKFPFADPWLVGEPVTLYEQDVGGMS